ncbi:hypothetical protein CRUP_037390 [Coryphaenoides rupestris]|nr:hypothetical protein CRUP_037390 [Coryphaenoides rupestris]
MANFIDLCRAPSNRVRGAPFRPARCMAVDLFPQTPHMEIGSAAGEGGLQRPRMPERSRKWPRSRRQ